MQIIIGNSIGVNRTSTLGGDPFEYTSIDNNYSMEFDGAGDYINCSNDPSLSSENFTIAVWINVNDLSSKLTIAGKGVSESYPDYSW